jgi:hypothetical protein
LYWEKRSDFGKATDFHQGVRVSTKHLIFIWVPEFQQSTWFSSGCQSFNKAPDFHLGARVSTKHLIFIWVPEFQQSA